MSSDINIEDISSKFSFEDFLSYSNKLDALSDENEGTLFLNESCVHAAIVTKKILDRAVVENIDVDMFCGSFFLFRESFKNIIDKLKEKMKDKISEDQADKFETFNPYEDLITSLKAFFGKDLHLNVILAKPLYDIKDDDNCGFFKTNMNHGLLNFRLLDDDLGIDHFMVSGNAFRKENSDRERTATCSFNEPKFADLFRLTFNNLKSYSSAYSF